MIRDEIVEDVRAVRQQLLEAAGGTLDALYAKLKEEQAKEKRRVVSLPPRRPQVKTPDAA